MGDSDSRTQKTQNMGEGASTAAKCCGCCCVFLVIAGIAGSVLINKIMNMGMAMMKVDSESWGPDPSLGHCYNSTSPIDRDGVDYYIQYCSVRAGVSTTDFKGLCADQGMHLASINSQDEAAAFLELWESTDVFPMFFGV